VCLVHEFAEKPGSDPMWPRLLLEVCVGMVQRATRVSFVSEQVRTAIDTAHCEHECVRWVEGLPPSFSFTGGIKRRSVDI